MRTYSARSWALTLGTMLGAGLGTFLLMTALMTGAFWWDATFHEGLTWALECWPFNLGAAVLVGLGALSGFSPEDL